MIEGTFSYIFKMDILCVLPTASAGGVHNKADDRCVVFVTRRYKECFVMKY